MSVYCPALPLTASRNSDLMTLPYSASCGAVELPVIKGSSMQTDCKACRATYQWMVGKISESCSSESAPLEMGERGASEGRRSNRDAWHLVPKDIASSHFRYNLQRKALPQQVMRDATLLHCCVLRILAVQPDSISISAKSDSRSHVCGDGRGQRNGQADVRMSRTGEVDGDPRPLSGPNTCCMPHEGRVGNTLGIHRGP